MVGFGKGKTDMKGRSQGGNKEGGKLRARKQGEGEGRQSGKSKLELTRDSRSSG